MAYNPHFGYHRTGVCKRLTRLIVTVLIAVNSPTSLGIKPAALTTVSLFPGPTDFQNKRLCFIRATNKEARSDAGSTCDSRGVSTRPPGSCNRTSVVEGISFDMHTSVAGPTSAHCRNQRHEAGRSHSHVAFSQNTPSTLRTNPVMLWATCPGASLPTKLQATVFQNSSVHLTVDTQGPLAAKPQQPKCSERNRPAPLQSAKLHPVVTPVIACNTVTCGTGAETGPSAPEPICLQAQASLVSQFRATNHPPPQDNWLWLQILQQCIGFLEL